MKQRLFWTAHSALLLIALVLPKALKVPSLAPEWDAFDLLGVLVPDILFVIVAEIAVLAAVTHLGPRAGQRLAAAWGAILLPLGTFVVVEHRFFLATGSLLDWQLFWHGLARLGEISGVVAAEIPLMWWCLLVLPLPVATAMALAGWREGARQRLPRGRPRWVAAAGVVVLLAAALLTPRPDPRLVLLRSTLPVALARQALAAAKTDLFGTGDVYLDYDLPEPLALETTPESKLVNLVFIVLESVRADATTPYTPALDTTPFLAKLSREGMLVQRHYTVIPHTTKSLVPILCGYGPDVRQALTESVPSALPGPCLPDLLKPWGYASAHFQPASRKFEQRKVLAQSMGFDLLFSWEDIDRARWESPNYLGVEDRAIIGPAMDWVDQQKGPFLLSILTLITHHDYQVPSTFEKKTYPGSERWSNYLNTIRYTDAFIEELFDAFDRRGLLENTLFIIVGDHGEGHGEHGRKGHDAIVYEEGIHVPAILWGPAVIPHPVTVTGNRQHQDFLPTIVDLLHLRVTAGKMEGTSLLDPVDDRVIHVSCWYRNRCLGRLDGDDKFIYYYNRSPNERFDLGKDPGETTNLAYTLEPEEVDRMVAEMKAWKHDRQTLYVAHQAQTGANVFLWKRPEPQQETDGRFKHRLEVLGYDPPLLRRGDKATMVVYLKVLGALGWHRKFRLSLADSAGHVFPLRFRSIEAKHPMYSWPVDLFIRDEFTFKVPAGAEPGAAEFRLYLQGPRKVDDKVGGSEAEPGERYIRLEVDIQE